MVILVGRRYVLVIKFTLALRYYFGLFGYGYFSLAVCFGHVALVVGV